MNPQLINVQPIPPTNVWDFENDWDHDICGINF